MTYVMTAEFADTEDTTRKVVTSGSGHLVSVPYYEDGFEAALAAEAEARKTRYNLVCFQLPEGGYTYMDTAEFFALFPGMPLSRVLLFPMS